MSSLIEQISAALAGRYRVDRELGFGGMATVYHAHDAKHERSLRARWQTYPCAFFGKHPARNRNRPITIEIDCYRLPSTATDCYRLQLTNPPKQAQL